MLLVIGVILALSVISALATTTPEQRAESRRRFARWNPLFYALIVIGLGIMLWPWPPQGH
jgi:hypothetical protein